MTDQTLTELYSRRILALAAGIPNTGRLSVADGSGYRRAPLCGSSVTVDVVVQDGRITGFAQDVRACALGQASASVLGARVLGCDRQTVAEGREVLRAMLQDDGPPPQGRFAELEALLPARAFKNRHASILLAFDATLAAMDASA